MTEAEHKKVMLAEMRRLNSRGFATCWVEQGEKNPTKYGWNRQSQPAEDYTPFANLGIQTGKLSDDMVCVDMDRRDVLAKADQYLPYTPMVDGRQGKPRSHRYYRVRNIPPDMIADTKVAGAGGPRTKRFGDAKIDWQGTGVQVVCPPSIHESGEVRVWDDPNADPAEVDFADLWDAVYDLAVEHGFIDRTLEAKKHVSKIKAVSGQGGHNSTFHVASALVNGFDLPAEEAFIILRAWNETNAIGEKWTDDELLHELKCAIDKIGTDPRYPRGYLIRDGRTFDDPDLLASKMPGKKTGGRVKSSRVPG
jgi:hypothetical protein